MRKLIAWNLMTLDGYFEGEKPWDLDFHGIAWGDELRRFSLQLGEEGDLLVFGRKTYEGMAAHWPDTTDELEIKQYMNAIEKIAVSRSMIEPGWNNARVVGDIVAELERLKRQDGKTIFIFGSAELIGNLMPTGLIDEIRVCLVPVLLGAGNPLFKPGPRQRLKLIGAQPLTNGSVILTYQPEAD